MFQSIVVAADGSEPSIRALTAACALASAFGSELHLIHAQEIHGPGQDALRQAAADILSRAEDHAKASGVAPSSATVVEGDPFEEIMTIVGLYGADLIVTGRRGLGNIGGLLAGSTSQQIATHSDCAHLSVK